MVPAPTASCLCSPDAEMRNAHEVNFIGDGPLSTARGPGGYVIKQADVEEQPQEPAPRCQPQSQWITGFSHGPLKPVKPLLIRALSALTIDSMGNTLPTRDVVKEPHSPKGGGHHSSSGGLKAFLRRQLSHRSAGSAGARSNNSQASSGRSRGTSADSSAANSEEDPTGDEGARKITLDRDIGTVVSPQAVNSVSRGHPNKIKTTKYTWLTWIPKSLYAQFKRVANVYFGMICIIVLFPWSPKDPRSKVGPFMMVLLWTCLKDLYEDNRRRKDDDNENQQSTWKWDFKLNELVKTNWQDILTGDVVLVPNDGTFPADLIMMQSKEGREAFMSTVMLDGETSLKERNSQKTCEKYCHAIREMTKQGARQAEVSKISMHSMHSAVDVSATFLCDLDAVASDSYEDRDSNDRKETKVIAATTATFDPEAAGAMEETNAEILPFMKLINKVGTEIEMGAPSEILSNVRGRLQIGHSAIQKEPGSPSDGFKGSGWKAILEANFLPRGCVLRNTPWVLGLTVYTGSSTKTRMKSSISGGKFSNMQVYLNYCVRGLLAALLLMCIYLGTMAKVFGDNEDSWIVMVLTYLVAIYHVVPMSLYIVYEVLKLILGHQVNTDKQMIDPDTGVNAVARTADLMEELGQIDFIFSDKTGTLTKNEMVFARCHVEGQDLGDFRTEEGISNAQQLVSGQDDSAVALGTKWMFTCLAVCHSVMVDKENKTSRYQGQSPDEVSLVQIAHEVGISFEHRERTRGSTSQELTLTMPGAVEKKLTLLHELEFTSDRKRMSVIVKMDHKIFCITKGADNVMEELLSSPLPDACKADITKFSQEGLRTLLVAAREVPVGEYQAWIKRWEAARRILDNTKEQKVREESANIEVGLNLIGATAVEDKLQDGCVGAIETVKKAGIRLWMLTGDKLETAVDIARSCKLFLEGTHLSVIAGCKDEAEVLQLLEAAAQTFREKEASQEGAEFGLVLDGKSVYHAMMNMDCRQLIFDLGMKSKSCVCCRLSPAQKLQLVELVRSVSPNTITLSIGDGANDVPMIEGAHLGVAVRGKEGAQAVQASDIAISQFRFIVPLLLCHGRRSYRRIALFLCYYLYKNVVLVMGDLIWAHQQMFKGQIAFPEYLSISFNGFFTSWHILFALGYDYDMPDDESVSKPELYAVGPYRKLFNGMIFAKWMMYGVVHGAVAWIVPFEWFGDKSYVKDEFVPFWINSVTSFIVVINTVMLKLFIHSVSPCKMSTVLPSVISVLLVLPCMLGLAYTSLGLNFQPCMEGLPVELFSNWKAVLSMVVVPPLALSFDILEKIVLIYRSRSSPASVKDT